MNKTRMGKRVASLLLSLVMMLSLLPTAAYAAMGDADETQGASVSENGTRVSDDSNSGGDTGDLQVGDSEDGGNTGDQKVEGSNGSNTVGDTAGTEGGADPTDSVNENDSTLVTPSNRVEVNGTVYDTLEAAIAAAEPVNGVITYEIYGKVEANSTESWIEVLKAGLTDVTKVAFVGKTDDAEISITNSTSVLADQNYDIDVSFVDLTLSHSNGAWVGDIGHATEYFTCVLRNTDAANNTVTYTNCTFPNGACNNQYGKTVFVNCEFTNTTSGKYNLWNYGGTTEITKSAFTGTRGIKTYNEGTLAESPEVAIKDTTFTGLTEKAAIVASKPTDIKLDSISATECTKGVFQKDIEGSADAEKVTIEANGSGISGNFNVTAEKTTEAAKDEFNITAGSFTAEVPSDYCAEGFTIEKKADGSYGVKENQPSANVAKVGDTEYATLGEAIAALSSSSYTLELLDESAWDVATPVYWAAGSESGYVATLADALTAAYMANAGGITIVCRPGTDVGKLTHGHVADNITIYGNNAYISSGECDLEVDTYMFSRDTGKQVTTGGAYLDKDITVTAYELDNLGVWGQRHTGHKVTVNLTDCDSVHGITVQRVYISGTTGVNDITLTGCDFGTKATSVYSNADGKVVIDNCSFTGAQVPVNFNHKANGTQTVTVQNSKFTNCGDNGDWKQFAAPVRFVNSGSGTMNTTVGTCTFTDTVGGNGDILLGDGREGEKSNNVSLTVENTAANVQAQQPGYYAKNGTTDESKQGTKNVAADDKLTTSVTQLMPSSETTYVAEVKGVKYKSLQAAIDKAGRNATVKLLADTRENVTIAEMMTLDLNGHTLNGGQVKAKPALTVTARVTVKDSSAAKTGTIMREDTAENSGVRSHYVIDIQGKGWLTFESGNVKNNSGTDSGKGASLVRVGDDSVDKYPGLNIKGGTFTQDNFIVIKVDSGDLFLNGGTLNSANSYAVENWHRAAIKGGTVNGTVAAWTYSGGHNSTLTISGGTVNDNVASVSYDKAEGKVAKVSITGGTVTGTLGTYTYGNGLIPIEDPAKATIAVTGGTFSKDPSKYVVENSGVTPNGDGTFGVAKAYLAKVGDTSYYTMDEAFKAQTASGKAIVLLRDYTTGSTFSSGSINRTVDLADHTWTCTGKDANSAAFEINYPDVTLTVKNGKVVSSQLVGLIPSAMGGTIKYDNSGLVFEDVVMETSARSGIETNGNNTNDTVTLRNSTLNVPNGFGIYFPSSGTLTIDNSVINAQTMGVQVCAGSLNISGAKTAITVSGDGIDKTINDGAIEDGAAISIVNRTGYKGLSKIEVEGGKFTAKGGNAAVKAYNWKDLTPSDFTQNDKVSVSGGTFSSAVDKSLCADGYIPTQNADGTFGVKVGADGYVEDENGNVTISTAEGLFYFAKKVNAGNNFAGKTVTLANNIDLNNEKWTPIGIYGTQATWFKGTFDGQNHAVTGLKVEESRKNGVGFFSKVYTGTIKNLTVEGSVSAPGCTYVGGIVGHGYATITNCTFKGTVSGSGAAQVGGIAGSGGFTVDRCSVYGDVSAGCWAGGIVGNCQDGGAYTNCYVEGTISSESTFWGGGAAGITPVPLYPSQVISGCYSNTVVKVAGEEVNCPIIAAYNNPLDYKGYSGGLKIYDNSWNKQKNSNDSYPIYAEKDGKGGVLMEGMTAARDNSLIMLEDDLNYVTGDLSKVRIMAGSSVTQAQIDALAVASVGDSKYQFLTEAINAAQDGQTVRLLADVAEDVVISKSIALDLGGKTLTNTNAGKATISVQSGTVTVKNGNVKGGTGYYNIEAKKDANLTLTDVAATAGNTGSSMIDNWGTLTITSGTYTGGLNVVKSEEGSVLNISGGTFTRETAPRWGITGTVLVYGTTTITGGTFNEKSTSTNARVVVTGRVDGYDSITYVKGGTFNGNGNNVFHHLSPAQADDSFEVSGGTFNKSIPDYYCADGFIPTKNAGGTYGVKEGQYVAKVGSKKYETLADAIRLAAKGKTITLLADVEQNTQLTINKSITLDLNGKTIRNTVDIWGDKANAILSITNGAKVTITGNGTIDAKENDCYTINVVKGDLTIENGTFYGNVSVVQVEEGTLSVKGGTFDLHQKWEGSSMYLFNCIDEAYVDGSANVAISGGTFVGFDPNVSPEQKVDGKVPSFAAPGVGITKNENGSFTAVDGMTAQILDEDGNSVNAYNTLAEAVAAAQNGQTITLLADVEQNTQLAIDKSITLDLNGKTIKNTVDIWGDNTNAILSIKKGAKVTITGNGTIAAKENDCYTINVVNGDLTIENGTFVGNISVVQVQKGSLTINGGAFSLLQKMTDGKGENRYLINCIDDTYADGSATVAISGGTFVGFDPNVSPEQKVDGKAPSFAAPGTGITRNADGSFTAVDGMTAQILDKDGNSVKAYRTLAEAVAAAEDGQTVRLLADVTLDAQIATGKAITIDGQSKYTIRAAKLLVSADNKAGMFYRTGSANGTLTFLNVTLDGNGVSKIFLNEGGAGETVFDGVTSTNGGGWAYGSGIHISGGGSHATIRNSTLTGSTGTMELNNANYYAANDLWVGGNVYVTVENSVIGTVFVNSAPSATATNGVVHGQLTITGESTKITYLSGEEESADKLDKFGNNGSLVKIDSGYVEKVFDKGSYAISGGTFETVVKKEWCAAGYVPADNGNGTYGVAVGMFTVMVTSRTTGSNSPVANVAGGGSNITYAQGTTVTASAISGYKFVGWFVNEYTGTPYSTDLACEVKPTDDWTMIAVYEPISGGVFALEVSASKFTVNGGATQRSYLLEKMPVGTQVTVVFKGSENFLYWVNESGKVVSTSKTYTFSMGSATTLKAVYAEKEENQAMVVFISHTQQVISSKGYTDTQEIQFPEPPIKMGATFVRWSMTEAEIRAAMATTATGIIVVEPVYEFSAGSYTVTVNYPNDETATYTAKVGKITTVTAKSIDGKVFKCWKNGDTVLGYTETLRIAPRGDLTLTAEYVDAGTTVDRLPVIALTEISASQQGAKYAVSFTATRSVPEGYTVTEQGILVSTNSQYGQEGALDAMKLDANGNRPDDTFILKATNTDATGVTVLNGTVSAADRTVYGRAYMILRDSSGAMVYVYSDTILSGSYNSLTTNGGN